MPKNMLRAICEYIQADDRNSNIMDCYEEYLDQAMDENTLIEICQIYMGGIKQDLEISGDIHGEVAEYYRWLGIEGEIR